MHNNQDKLKEEVGFLENRVNCYKQLETNLKARITELETRVNGYYKSAKTSKEIYDREVIGRTVGIGYDYNKAIGKLGINSPNRISAKERGIPHVLKDVVDPLFKKSIAEPLNESSIIINEELHAENVMNAEILTDKCVPKVSVKVVPTTKTNLCKHKSELNNNASSLNNMPLIDLSHKACSVVNCMSCAFNVMSAYFNSKHASNYKTAPRQHLNSKKHVKTKTARPPSDKVEAFVPKPKHSVVKAVYVVKCPVTEKIVVEKVKVVVIPDKGQFFKYAGPNQVWVPKKV